jgi:phosphatidylethanolamine-binding protein (PEBP) family uncharacterized protein
MSHPFFDAKEYPAHRDDARQLLDALVAWEQNPKRIKLVYRKCGEGLRPLALDDHPDVIWMEVLDNLVQAGALQRFVNTLLEENSCSQFHHVLRKIKEVRGEPRVTRPERIAAGTQPFDASHEGEASDPYGLLLRKAITLLQSVPGTEDYERRTLLIKNAGGDCASRWVEFRRIRESKWADITLIVRQAEAMGRDVVAAILRCAARDVLLEQAQRDKSLRDAICNRAADRTVLRDTIREAADPIGALVHALRWSDDPAKREAVDAVLGQIALSTPGGLVEALLACADGLAGPKRQPDSEDTVEDRSSLSLFAGPGWENEESRLDYTIEGNNASPPLRWVGVPRGTNTFALVMQDLDGPEGRNVHWVQHSIPGTQRALDRDAGALGGDFRRWGIPAQADAEARGLPGYSGPQQHVLPHRYRLTLLALTRGAPAFSSSTTGREVLALLDQPVCLAHASLTVAFWSPYSPRTFLFERHPLLGRLFGARPWMVFCLFAVIALVGLDLPAWLLNLHSLPHEGWDNSIPGACTVDLPENDRGLFHQYNWSIVYTVAVPLYFAFAAKFSTMLRGAAIGIARRPGGVIRGSRERPFVAFLHDEVTRYARATLVFAWGVTFAVMAIDTRQLWEAFLFDQFSCLRPYWAMGFFHENRVDYDRNIAFNLIAYSMQGMFVFLLAFVTAKFFLVLHIVSRTIRGRYNAVVRPTGDDRYVFDPYWGDPEHRMGLGPLGRPYNAYIILTLLVTLFAVLYRMQTIGEKGGLHAYWADFGALLGGDFSQLGELGRWDAMTSGMKVMLVALAIPCVIIIYFPLLRIRSFLRQQRVAQLRICSGLRTSPLLAEQREVHLDIIDAVVRTNVWPNGDGIALLAMYSWISLYLTAVYPPALLLAVPALAVLLLRMRGRRRP